MWVPWTGTPIVVEQVGAAAAAPGPVSIAAAATVRVTTRRLRVALRSIAQPATVRLACRWRPATIAAPPSPSAARIAPAPMPASPQAKPSSACGCETGVPSKLVSTPASSAATSTAGRSCGAYMYWSALALAGTASATRASPVAARRVMVVRVISASLEGVVTGETTVGPGCRAGIGRNAHLGMPGYRSWESGSEGDRALAAPVGERDELGRADRLARQHAGP